MLKQYLSNQTKRSQHISLVLVILIVAGIGTYLIIFSHAAIPYASINADKGTLANGATSQSCTGASDGSCVVFAANMGPRTANGPFYTPASVWNTPIVSNPTIASNDASLIAAWSDTSVCGANNCLHPGYDFTPAIWVANNSTTLVPVRIDYPTCNARTVQVPIPAGAVPDPGFEGHMVIIQSDSGVEYDFFKAQSPGQTPKSGGSCATANEWTTEEVQTTNWQTGNGLEPGFGGWGFAEGAGVILPRDSQQPAGSTWDHAVALSYRNTCSKTLSWCPIVPPGTSEDGTCTIQSQCVPEGARFQLDPSIDCSTWPSLQYEWQRQMCRTFQAYGGIVVDTNGAGDGITIYDQWRGSLGSYTWPWLQTGNIIGLPSDLLPHFRVLTW